MPRTPPDRSVEKYCKECAEEKILKNFLSQFFPSTINGLTLKREIQCKKLVVKIKKDRKTCLCHNIKVNMLRIGQSFAFRYENH